MDLKIIILIVITVMILLWVFGADFNKLCNTRKYLTVDKTQIVNTNNMAKSQESQVPNLLEQIRSENNVPLEKNIPVMHTASGEIALLSKPTPDIELSEPSYFDDSNVAHAPIHDINDTNEIKKFSKNDVLDVLSTINDNARKLLHGNLPVNFSVENKDVKITVPENGSDDSPLAVNSFVAHASADHKESNSSKYAKH